MSGIPAIRTADLIVRNGRIHTLDRENTVASSLAVVDGEIAAVGDDRETAVLLGPATEVIDLGGRTVVPGLNDSHAHSVDAGNSFNLEVRWDRVTSLADALRLLRERAAHATPGQWVRVIGGWSEFQFAEKRLPTLDEVNSVSEDVPVMVVFLDALGFLNRAALRALGYDKTTPDPPDGEIQRDAAGTPTGLLLAMPSPAVLGAALLGAPQLDREERINSTHRFLRELNRFGVTSVIDAGATGFPDAYDAVRTLRDQQRLTIRTACDVFPARPGHELADYERLTDEIELGGDDWLRYNGAGEALTLDGVDFSSFMQPRPDLPESMERNLEPVVRLLVARRWPFRFHASYDESIQRILGVLEKVNRDIPFDGLRWAVEHAETIRPETIDRVAALGGGIAVQHRIAFRGEHFLRRYGPDAARRVQPVMEMLERGIPVGGGTDGTWIASYHPWLALRWFVTGTTVGGLQMWRPEHRLDRTLALRLFTEGSAWFSGEERRKGTLEPGRMADFAVLSADYFSVPEAEIADVGSVLTVVGGRVVYEDGPFARADALPRPLAV